jgi:hypothetical protein
MNSTFDNLGLKVMMRDMINQTFVHLINSCGWLTVRASNYQFFKPHIVKCKFTIMGAILGAWK